MINGDLSTKLTDLNCKYLSDNKLWIHAGTVMNVFMSPLLSGSLTVTTNYSCSSADLVEIKGESDLRKNMIVIYDRESFCIQQNELDLDVRDLTIKTTNSKIQLVAPIMDDLVLDMAEIMKGTRINCMTSFHKILLVRINCIDCGAEAANWISRYVKKRNLGLAYVLPQSKSKRTFWDNLNDLYMSEPEERNIVVPFNIVPHFTLISYRSYIEMNKILSYPMQLERYNADICIMPDEKQPFSELEWEWISIGNAIIRNINPWKRDGSIIDLMQMPIEMKLKMMLLNCELYQSGKIRSGDEVFICGHRNIF